mgnify:CR=1 FL=1
MKYYIDMVLLPDAEVHLAFIWQKVFQQVHIALVENKIGPNESAIAICIVHYGEKTFPLGNTLRLLANNEADLQRLDIQHWLRRFPDYCHIKPIQSIPVDIQCHANFRRKQAKSIYKKAERRAAHLNKPYEEVLAYLLNERPKKRPRLPFIILESQETKKRIIASASSQFALHIDKTIFSDTQIGTFDCYGLSKVATVPYF